MEGFPWWNDAQKELAKEAKTVTDEVLLPLAEESAWKREYPWAAVREMAKRGWYGTIIPAKYGGRGEEWGITGACIIAEETARAGEITWIYGASMVGGIHQIVRHGTEEQKQRWLPRIAGGELQGSITITEPYAGSDVAGGIETTARREGDFYLVNGKKRFQTNSGAADFYMTYVKTSARPEDRAKYRHLTALLVEKGTPGFTIEKVNDLMAVDGVYNCYLSLDNARVPVANRLGDEGDGWEVMTRGLNFERLFQAASPLGRMREALKYAVHHLQRRVQFGQPTMNITINQFKVADIMWRLLMSRLITYYTAYLLDIGQETPLESATAKLFDTDNQLQVAIDAIQCMGGDGVTRYYPVERTLRDAKVEQISAGTNEIMRLIIFRQGLRIMADDLKVPCRIIHSQLKVPMPVGKVPPKKSVSGEGDILAVLAENYRVNPGLHMTLEDIRGQLDIAEEDLNKHLLSLEEQGLVNLFRDRQGKITLARATYDGLARANPLEYYQYIPPWVNEKDLF